MFVLLGEYLTPIFSVFNVFQYLTFRTIAGILTALFIAFLLGPYMIRKLKTHKIGQVVRDDGPETHLSKRGTPTMGGALILVAIMLSTILWADLRNRYIWVVLFITFSFGIIGFIDDYKKLVLKDAKGLASRYKYLGQSIFGFVAAVFLYLTATQVAETQLFIPFFKNFVFDLGEGFIILAYFVIVGTSNAVNLTDGLDGLAIVPTMMVGVALGLFAYLSGHAEFSRYLMIPSLPGAGELLVFCGALLGAGLGFLWFNTHPAEVFMGDIGSLSLGAALGVIAVITRQELVLFIMGGIFVVETVSVIIQVASFKLFQKRVFLMAPIHHHFEKKGWKEPQIVVRFWIISFVLVLIGLASLKLR